MTENLVKLLGIELKHAIDTPFLTSLKEQPNTNRVDDRFYAEFPASGVSLAASNNLRVTAVQLYAPGHQGYKGFDGSLPEGVRFSNSRSEAHSKLGKPNASGGGSFIKPLGRIPSWDRFDRVGYSLHLQYADNEATIALVTLMSAESVPK